MEAMILPMIRLGGAAAMIERDRDPFGSGTPGTTMVATLSHDLGNHLQAVSSALNILMRKLRMRDLDGADAIVAHAQNGLEAAGRLSSRLMSDGAELEPRRRQVNVDALVEAMLPVLRLTVGDRINVTTRLESKFRSANCDEHALETAILNLVVNARDALPRGGNIRIDATLRCGRNDEITLGREHLCVTVRDDGIGMTEDQLNNACEPRYSTKPGARGRGLGLPSVCDFAAQSGGWLEIESAVGRGTAVRIHLPAGTPL